MLKGEDSGFPAKKRMVILNSWDTFTMPLLSNRPHHLINTLDDIINLHRNHDIISYRSDVHEDSWTEACRILKWGQKAHIIICLIFLQCHTPFQKPEICGIWELCAMQSCLYLLVLVLWWGAFHVSMINDHKSVFEHDLLM